jgi:MerR family transcriptional regulator, light-induced transcriptional regulator
LLLAGYILKANGKKVIYLGQNVPYENLTNVINTTKPSHLYTFFVRNPVEEDVKVLLTNLKKQYKNIKICVSGKQEIVKSTSQKNKLLWIKDIDALQELIKQ